MPGKEHRPGPQEKTTHQVSALEPEGQELQNQPHQVMLTWGAQRALQDPSCTRPADILDLQHLAGNRAVSHLIQTRLTVGPAGDRYEQEADRVAEQVVSSQPPGASRQRSDVHRQEDEEEVQAHTIQQSAAPVQNTVQAKLDVGTYSKGAFSRQGIKAGSKVRGKTTFHQLVDELTTYHGLTSQKDELESLQRLITLCDAWTLGHATGKKHWYQSQEKEDLKANIVGNLKTAAQGEIGDITKHMEEATYHSVTDLDAKVNAAGQTLAEALGKLDVPTLLATNAGTLREEYVARVFLPRTMAMRAARDPGLPGHIFRMMGDIAANIQKASLHVQENKDLVDLVVDNHLGDNAWLNQNMRAPEYAQGAGGEQAIQPGVMGWSVNKQILVGGNLNFQNKINALMTIIASLPVGQALLSQIGAVNPSSHTMETVMRIVPPTLSGANYEDPSGHTRYASSTADITLATDPESIVLGVPAQVATERWRARDAAVAMFHEMIHVYIQNKGGEDWHAQNNNLLTRHIGSQGDDTELRIVGVRYIDPDNGGVFAWDDPTYNPITENQFRKEYARSKGLTHTDLRPSYANIKGQAKITNWKDVIV